MAHPGRRTILSGAFCLCCAATTRAAAPEDWAETAPGIFVRNGLVQDATAANADAIANTSFVIGQSAVAVFDPGGSLADGQAMRAAIRRRTNLPIRAIILSHVHPDHVFGAAAFAADRPEIIGHAALPESLGARGAFYQRNLATLLGPAAGSVPSVTRTVASTGALDLGGRTLQLHAHPPAHTGADLTALDTQTGILLAGDLLFVGRVPSLDGDLKGWIALLPRLQASRAIPGHGPALVSLPDAAAPLTRYLTTLRDQTRAAIAAGTPIEDASRSVAIAERPRWALFDDYNPRNVLEAYHQLEWE